MEERKEGLEEALSEAKVEPIALEGTRLRFSLAVNVACRQPEAKY